VNRTVAQAADRRAGLLSKPEINIGAMLTGARERAGLTQAELAARMKLSRAEVAHLEAGYVTPSWLTIERFAKAWNTNVTGLALSIPF
jgi:transcriptional regulator with XRE-family HTH domain